MRIIYSADHRLHAPEFEILDGVTKPYFESPERAEIIRSALAAADFAEPIAPKPHGIEPILAVHHADYLAYLERAYSRWIAAGLPPSGVMPSAMPLRGLYGRSTHPTAEAGYYCFDLSAPIVAGTYAAARNAADAALTGADLLLAGERAAYALCRPPGHHAARDVCGGYCFINNAAVAAHHLALAATGPRDSAWAMRPATVAVLDIDYHHGNGTQDIFYERSDVLFVSIHAAPDREYPYFLGFAEERGAAAGEGYNLNLPLDPGITDDQFVAALDIALDEIAAYSPRYLVVSAGFDTFIDDPLGDFAVTTAGYRRIGAQIAALRLPTLFVQEGGYAVSALGTNVAALLDGFRRSA